MNKSLLKPMIIFVVLIIVSATTNAQTQIIINEYSQGPAGTTGDWIELVVTADGTDIRGVYYDDDNTSGPGDIVTNGDMELDANWIDVGTPTLNERSSTQAHGGTYSRKLVTAGTGWNGITQTNVSFSPNKTYRLSFWIYSVSGVTIRYSVWDGNNDLFGNASSSTTAGQWINITKDFFTSSNADNTGSFQFKTNATVETFYIDDVSIHGPGNFGKEYSVQLKSIPAFESVNRGSTILIYRNRVTDNILPELDDTDFSDGTLVIHQSNTDFLTMTNGIRLIGNNPDEFGIFFDNGNLSDVLGIHGIAHGRDQGHLAFFSSGWGYTVILQVGAGQSAHFTEDTPGEVGTSGNWAIQEFSSATPGTLNGGNNNALPVELTSFAAILKENQVQLNWMTATEVNNYGFDIERKREGENWNTLGFVEGHGNTNSPKEYSFLDNDMAAAGKYFYRLKQIDNDGTYEYSKSIFVDLDAPVKFDLKQNFPNPFNPSTTISFNLPYNDYVTLKVFNAIGEEVQTLFEGNLDSGIHQYNFIGDELPSGLYVYMLSTNNLMQTKKMLLLK